jgi:hypothetical protein
MLLNFVRVVSGDCGRSGCTLGGGSDQCRTAKCAAVCSRKEEERVTSATNRTFGVELEISAVISS